MPAIDQPQSAEPMAWRRDSFSGTGDYSVQLSDTDRAQMRSMLAAIEAGGRLDQPTLLSRAEFAWGELGTRFEQAFEQVRAGRGFALIRGLPVKDVDLRQF